MRRSKSEPECTRPALSHRVLIHEVGTGTRYQRVIWGPRARSLNGPGSELPRIRMQPDPDVWAY